MFLRFDYMYLPFPGKAGACSYPKQLNPPKIIIFSGVIEEPNPIWNDDYPACHLIILWDV